MRTRISFGMIVIGGLLSLAGCTNEPDFDERYDAASARIQAAAQDIDAQIAATGAPLEAAEASQR